MKRLTKGRDEVIFGVCAGLGEYFDVDPTIVRILFLIAAFFGYGSPVLIYIILAIAMPEH